MVITTNLTGVRALVTGATSGLGEAMAEALLSAGATVAVSARPTPRLDAAVRRWAERGLAAEALDMDVREPESVEAGARKLAGRWDRIDLVVNNAGIGTRTVNPHYRLRPIPFFEVTPLGFSDVIATNLTGFFLVARSFAPLLIEQGRGGFVNISVNQATMRRPGFVPYGPSRAGSEALSAIMTEDLRPYGIDVNVLLPGGGAATGMIPDLETDPGRNQLLPPQVMGPPVTFLASSEARGVTGERIVATEFGQWLAAFRGEPLTGQCRAAE
jgi:NAD(P)-dependent dehydrogenase (short-subunit alcohol dehydrogenase family)